MPAIVDPTGTSSERLFDLAPRDVRYLDGKTLGLLDSSKPNSDRVLEAIAQMLQQRYEMKEIVRRRKPSFARPAPPELVEELVRACDVVVTGIGD